MNVDPDTGLIVRPLDRFAASCAWMRDQLRERRINLHGGCHLARGLDALERFRETVVVDDRFRFETTEAAYDASAEIYGVDFLTKALHWGTTAGLALDDRRWKLLAKSDPIITRGCGAPSKPRNETWEIVVASLAATFACDVRFDEPDVTCRYGDRRYAIAAKVAYSVANVVENIEKGFEQARTKGDVVLVFVNMVSLYPQVDTLRWSRCRRFAHNDEAVAVMQAAVARWCTNWPLERLARRLRGRASEPIGVAFFVPMFLDMAGAPRPFLYTHMPLVWDRGSPDYEFATAFLRACNVVGSFTPSAEAVVSHADIGPSSTS